jgi:hypothetical protein
VVAEIEVELLVAALPATLALATTAETTIVLYLDAKVVRYAS